MKLERIFGISQALTRRGFAGLLLLPAAAAAARNDDFRRDDDYYRRDDDFRRGSRRGYSGAWRAFASDNYEPRRPDGRFDLRAIVDGDAEFAIRGNEIMWRAFNGDVPHDDGSEYRKEIPRAELYGLRLEQRDGRERIQVVEEPSPRNGWALVLRIQDHKGGADRYHARVTWETDGEFQRDRGGYGPGRWPYDRGRY